MSGGAMRDRTADLLRARQALSQLSYSPIMCRYGLSKSVDYNVRCIRANARREMRKFMNNKRRVSQRSNSEELVGLSRLELPTSRLSGVRSNQLSYRPFVSFCLSYQAYLCEHSTGRTSC